MSTRVYTGTEWKIADTGLKVKAAAGFTNAYKLKVRLTDTWLPGSQTTLEESYTLTWEVEAPTAPPPPIQYYVVPAITGMTIANANTAIQLHHTVGNITYTNTSVLANDNLVASQNPASGVSVPEDTPISYVVYNYVTPTFTVPALNGLLKSNAENAVTELGGTIAALNTEETYDTNLLGRVKTDSQYPAAGSTANVGSSVTFIYYIQAPLTTVPNIVGLSANTVYDTLTAANLTLGAGTQTQTEVNADSDAAKIYAQGTAAGTSVPVNTAINYSYYIANTHVAMINIVGLTTAAATSALQAKELYLGTETGTTETATTNLIGTIKTQGVAVGVSTPIYTSINYTTYVAIPKTNVPYLSGLTLANATAALSAAYLTAGSITTVETTNANLEGTVVPNSQSPAYGTEVNRNSSVSYQRYVPNTTTTVPSITNQTVSYAATLCTNAELVLSGSASSSTEADVAVDTVYYQTPAAGSVVAINSTVYYYKYVPYTTKLVPNVVGQAEQTAKNNITSAGLNWSVTDRQLASGSSETAGIVYSQSPASGGARVAAGSTVTITVNRAYVPTLHTGSGSVTVNPNWGAYYYTSSGTRVGSSYSNGLYVGSELGTTGNQKFALLSINAPAAFTAMRNQTGGGAASAITLTGINFNFNTGTMASGASDVMDWRFYTHSTQSSSSPTSLTQASLGSEVSNPQNLTSLTIYSIPLGSTLTSNLAGSEICWPLGVVAFSNNKNHYTSINSPTFTIYYNWSATY